MYVCVCVCGCVFVCVGVCVCVCERVILRFSGKPVYLRLQNKYFGLILLNRKNVQNPDFTGETITDI